jgi:signal transduction histidine kinase
MSEAGSGVATAAATSNRSVLAHLLHALNQPLTGLQCSMELALSTPRTPEQQARTLREGLELTERMRLLVETIREVTEAQPEPGTEPVSLDPLVRETADTLVPVAESKNVSLVVQCSAPSGVRANRRRMEELIFRLLDSGLSLARSASRMRIATSVEGGQWRLAVSWNSGPAPEHSPFSRAELGLLVARAGWEQAGAIWTQQSLTDDESCILRLPVFSETSSLSEPPAR